MSENPVPPPAFFRVVAIGTLLGVLVGSGASAQEIPIDRWLVTGAEADAVAPLLGGGTEAFPDRNLPVGPGTWTLLREDGRSRNDLGSGASPATLGHAYLRASRDVTVDLSLEVEPCADLTAWLNAQPLVPGESRVRLAAGWNTLLVELTSGDDCPRALDASLARGRGLRGERAREAGPAELRVQASKPPGVRRHYPEGVLTVSTPRIVGLSWRPGDDRLRAEMAFALTSWGRGPGGPADEGAGERPTAPPAIDLTGSWDLTLYSPTGIQRARAELSMDEDGALRGEIRREESREADRPRGPALEGRIRDGWVSGRRFAWRMEAGGGRRSFQLTFRGTVEDGELQGRIAFEGARDLESRFEGRRPGSSAEDEAAEPEAGPDAAGAEPGPEGGGDTPAVEDTLGPTDPDGLRARMIRQLLPPEEPAAPAPVQGSVELRVAGERIGGRGVGLVPARPEAIAGFVPFRKLLEASRRERGLEARLRWDDGDRELSGPMPPVPVLEAFHGPIAIEGLSDRGDGARSGELRVPDTLDGFTLRVGSGSWSVGGEPISGENLCAPCSRGQRLAIEVRTTGEGPPTVTIADRGFVDASDRAGAPPAIEWLRTLEEDPRAYRELAGSQ
ncbi:MAG: hypothetical protein R3266_02595 [Gemmatimonadota bacterium]|nr:hypothetical protein [Gemmatimonadota bacterium]